MNDPLGLHSAVIGMLSLSQSGSEMANNSMQQMMNQQQNAANYLANQMSMMPSGQTQISNRQQGPLTPPGSPEEQQRILAAKMEASSPQKEVNYPETNPQSCANNQYSVPILPNQPAIQQNPLEALVKQDIFANPLLAGALQSPMCQQYRRARSEKKLIPDEQKDEKYFERRHRNNTAAKKSRDCRKLREEEISIKASYLERENTTLRTQLAMLREESNKLQALLFQKRQMRMSSQANISNPYNTALG